jgi:CheY-like chemotaxis protein
VDLSIRTEAVPGGPPAAFPALLIDRGLISRDDLAVAEPHAVREHLELADTLVVLGLVSEADSYATLAAAAGAEVMALEGVASSKLAVQLVPERLARRHLVVPLQVDNRTLTYATCRPFSDEADRDLGFASGRRTKLIVATRSAVMSALDRCYPKATAPDLLGERLRAGLSPAGDARAATGSSASSVSEMCALIIGRAVDIGASEVRIECGPQGETVRYGLRGVFETMTKLPAAVSQPVRDRFKTLACVGIAVRHRPQEGTFRLTVKGRPTDVRLSTVPTPDGEQIMMRVIDGRNREAAANATAEAPKMRKRLRVLVTDDEPITRMLVKLLLEREHFDVLEATNGGQAIEIAVRERPDLLLIDLNMPVMDGYQAIQNLRLDPGLATLPIIVLTAEDGDSIERRVLELGANDYMVKPFEPAVLLARVNAVFGRLNMMAA